ncbi:MAG: 50S ribosomal protein L10 [Candidatus Thorarchaeota archaeon]|nr:50S ribosomal protein L10 [Candidatus Thorarchaeota archaeon]
MTVYEHDVPQWKKDTVNKLSDMIEDSEMVGLVNVEGVGAKQMHGIRESLRGSAVIKMARNTLMKRAIEKVNKEGIQKLEDHVKGPVAFVFSNQNPFRLSQFLKENKAAAPAKGGQVTPKDIIVPSMNTGVAPGPFISELAALDIPSRVKGGVIHITEETVAVEAGEIVSNAMSQMLGRLGIEPMELQLKLIAAYTDGTLLTEDVLEIDLQDIFKEVVVGHQFAVNLSINAGYPTADTIPMVIAKADIEAKSLALSTGFVVPDMIGEFLAKANAESLALAKQLANENPDAIPSEIIDEISSVPAASPAQQPQEEEVAESEDEEVEDEEVEATEGLGSMFG